MKTVSFTELEDMCAECGGLTVSLEGYGDIEEIRIMILEDPDGRWRANWARLMNNGEIIYGSRDDCIFSADMREALCAVLEDGAGLDDARDYGYDVFGVRRPYDPSRAGLCGGTEAWDNYEYATDLI